MKSLRIFKYLLLIIILSIYGCFSHPKYPQNWSSVQKETKCPDIGGHYKNRGETETNGEYKPYLYSILFGGETKDIRSVKSIKIYQKTNELLFEAYANGSLFKSRVAKINPDDCGDGFIQINVPEPEGAINRDGVVGYTWEAIRISKDMQGNLIIRNDSSGVGIVLLIPVAGSQWSWYRFSQIK